MHNFKIEIDKYMIETIQKIYVKFPNYLSAYIFLKVFQCMLKSTEFKKVDWPRNSYEIVFFHSVWFT